MGSCSAEGVDDAGFIVSGADLELIPPLYRPALETCVSRVADVVEGLVAVFVYGSVATGRATPPESDIDLLIVTRDDGASAQLKVTAAELSAQYRDLVHDVGIAHVTIGELFADNIDALGNRCFIKHYCVPLHGDDLRSRLPACRPSATMAWAFNHNIADAIDHARHQLEGAASAGEVRAVCRAAARKVLLATASLTSVITSSWTTDRRRAAALVAGTYPEWAHDATAALEWTTSPTDDETAIRRFLDGFATWVAGRLQTVTAPGTHPRSGRDSPRGGQA